MEKSEPKIKECPNCGSTFECAHNASCWCMDYTISDVNLELIKAKYSNCLCPKCLAAYSENKK